jgi:hypothetical protein
MERDKFVNTSQKILCLLKILAVITDYGNSFNVGIKEFNSGVKGLMRTV